MELLLATNNQGKLEEFQRLFEGSGHSLKSYADLGLEADPEETGATFDENAVIKAKAGCAASGMPTLADDSGLCVDAMNGGPGVLSARFAGPDATDAANRAKLLDMLSRTPYAKRGASFECSLALAMPEGALLTAHGGCRGIIGFAEAGENGFGYDSVFYINNKSFADISGEEKDKISHRALAVNDLLEKLPAFLGAPAAPEETGEEAYAGEEDGDEAE